MRFEAFHDAVLKLPGAALDIKWGQDRAFVVGGKMFVRAGSLGQDEPRYIFKASDLAFELLVEQGLARPAPYLAKAKWVQMVSADALSDEELMAYVARAHALVAAKLPKAVRLGLGLA